MCVSRRYRSPATRRKLIDQFGRTSDLRGELALQCFWVQAPLRGDKFWDDGAGRQELADHCADRLETPASLRVIVVR
jgi:hypothetical protein